MTIQYCDIKKLKANAKADKWWESAVKKKSGDKWKTLVHNGILFPPPYEPLPSNIKIKHKGVPISLDAKNLKNPFNVSAEEAAVFFAIELEKDARLSETKSSRVRIVDEKFKENFWKNWKLILGSNSPIKSINDVDFSPIQKYIVDRSEKKKQAQKARTKEEKAEEKEKKEELKSIYGYAIVDGVLIPIGNYVVQPPGLYLGHGAHPLRGNIKKRLAPSDITLNVSKTNVPRCIINKEPCKWGDVVEKHDVTWIATWKHPITNEPSYVNLSRTESVFVCANDMEKFEKARKLAKNINKVREKYTKDLNSENDTTRQLATVVYLLDVLAIRPGGEKDEDKEADTQGLTTLTCDTITFDVDNNITINFIGKSSIKFEKTFKVSSVVYNNLKKLCRNKGKSHKIFPDADASALNEYLKTLLPDLTAKVFRTYKASSILQGMLNENKVDPYDLTHEKKLVYDRVNIEVAKALNHKKMGGSDARLIKLKEKIAEYREKRKNATTDKQKATAQKNIDATKVKLEEAEQNISTGTSKGNYLDPRIAVAWCKMNEMPIEKIYNKTNLKKFIWALETPSDWQF